MKETKQVKKNKAAENTDGPLFDESLEIFGEHKTRQQVKAEEKVRKQAERAALKAEMEKRRKAAKEGGVPAKRKDIITVVAVVTAILLLCVLALGNSLLRSKPDTQWEIDEARGYILKADCNPEISSEGPKADVMECYFTKNDHLYVEVALRNGTDRPVRVDALDIVVTDHATGDGIAGGKVFLEEELILPVMEIVYYSVYVSPEHLSVDADYVLPDVCGFEFLIEATPVEVE
ncbi:MAG: hypothetical protein IJN04_01695 [Clostridia bacterium]|nr:hypothetical protein [Clostridia bacterium]